MTNITYRLIIGEQGNEMGHIIPTRATTERGVQVALARVLASYHGDSWGRVEVNYDDTGWQRIQGAK